MNKVIILSLIMAIARRDILPNNSFAHCTWRCLNREFFLSDNKVKDYILETWKTYKDRYEVKIFDYCILSNHVHLVVKAKNADNLGDFMRVCNSLIARYINKLLSRDSHALRERYKSPLIEEPKYFINTLIYVWLNYYKATGIKPLEYKYGSIYYRAQGLENNVLSSYDCIPFEITKPVQHFVVDLLNAAMSKYKLNSLASEIYEHSHTIGSARRIKERSTYFESLRREKPS